MNPDGSKLAALQSWLLAAIVKAEEPADAEVAQHVAASRALTAGERLGVYRHAYLARLLEVLREWFPCTRYAVGGDLFDQLCGGYLQAHPPTSYTLGRLADHFAEYLERTRPADWGQFVVELVRLELAIERVFDAAGPEGLPPFRLPEGMNGETRLALVPGCELLQFAYPVSSYFTDWKAGKAPVWPAAGEQFVALYRRDFVVRRSELQEGQFRLLVALQGGATLQEGVEAAAKTEAGSHDEFARKLREWFEVWAREGLFAAVG